MVSPKKHNSRLINLIRTFYLGSRYISIDTFQKLFTPTPNYESGKSKKVIKSKYLLKYLLPPPVSFYNPTVSFIYSNTFSSVWHATCVGNSSPLNVLVYLLCMWKKKPSNISYWMHCYHLSLTNMWSPKKQKNNNFKELKYLKRKR